MEQSASNAAPPAAGLKLRRFTMNAIALALVYGNATVVLQPPAFYGTALQWRTPGFVRDAFLMTGMFSSYSAQNLDFSLAGQRTQSGRREDRGRWIALPLHEYFVARHGVTFTQMFAAHDWDVHGSSAQQRAWAFLARKIRERHNRLHPDQSVARVQLASVQWPQDPRGYRAGKRAAQIVARTWYVEPPP